MLSLNDKPGVHKNCKCLDYLTISNVMGMAGDLNHFVKGQSTECFMLLQLLSVNFITEKIRTLLRVPLSLPPFGIGGL